MRFVILQVTGRSRGSEFEAENMWLWVFPGRRRAYVKGVIICETKL